MNSTQVTAHSSTASVEGVCPEKRRGRKPKAITENTIPLRFDARYPKANLTVAHEFEDLLDEFKYDEFEAAVAFFLMFDDYPLRVVHDSLCVAYRGIYPKRSRERLGQLLIRAMHKYHESVQDTVPTSILFAVRKKG